MNIDETLNKISEIIISPQEELILIHLFFKPNRPTDLARRLERTSQYFSCKIFPKLSKLGLIRKKGNKLYYLTDMGIGYLLLRYEIELDENEVPVWIRPSGIISKWKAKLILEKFL